jgi:hypothetical protein
MLALLSACDMLCAFHEQNKLDDALLCTHALLWGLAWDAKTRTSDALDQFVAQNQLVPPGSKLDKLVGTVTKLSVSPLEKDNSMISCEVMLVPMMNKCPVLSRLRPSEPFSHCLFLPRAALSHFYVVTLLDEFAQTYFPRIVDSRKRKFVDETRNADLVDTKRLEYAVMSDEKNVYVYGDDGMLSCFLCYLGLSDCNGTRARFEFLLAMLPAHLMPALGYAMQFAGVGTDPHHSVTCAELKFYAEFTTVEDSRRGHLPSAMKLATGKLTDEASKFEPVLLWNFYQHQSHHYDLSNTARHGFALPAEVLKEQELAMKMINFSHT